MAETFEGFWERTADVAEPSNLFAIITAVLVFATVFTLSAPAFNQDQTSKRLKQLANRREELRRKLNMSVNEIELSVRAANCLNNANITTVGELAQKTEAEMLKYRNFGKKSLNEIKQKIFDLGLNLGMTFDSDLLMPVVEAQKPE